MTPLHSEASYSAAAPATAKVISTPAATPLSTMKESACDACPALRDRLQEAEEMLRYERETVRRLQSELEVIQEGRCDDKEKIDRLTFLLSQEPPLPRTISQSPLRTMSLSPSMRCTTRIFDLITLPTVKVPHHSVTHIVDTAMPALQLPETSTVYDLMPRKRPGRVFLCNRIAQPPLIFNACIESSAEVALTLPGAAKRSVMVGPLCSAEVLDMVEEDLNRCSCVTSAVVGG